MKVKTTTETYSHLCELLDTSRKVYYSRFGDGDFNIMRGVREKLHEYSDELSRELIEAFLIDDVYYVRGAMLDYPHEPGMRRGIFSPPDDIMINKLYLKNILHLDESVLFDSHIMFHYISVFRQDLMYSFLEKYIRPKRKMFIGSVPEPQIKRLIGNVDYYVEVPKRNAYYSINEWYPHILQNIDDVELCIPAAGMAGRVINKRLWQLEKEIHSIDLGSVIDAACNITTRTWIKHVGYTIENLLL